MNRLCACRKSDAQCPECGGSGVSGRIPLLEMLPIGENMRRMLAREATTPELESFAAESGFASLAKNGKYLVRLGLVAKSEIDTAGL